MSIGTSHASTRTRAVICEPLRQQACLRCGYRWLPRQVTRPVRCPACKSPYWHRPRKPPRQAQEATSASQAFTGMPGAQTGAESFQAALEAMKTMKQAGKSWGEIAEAIDSRFGVKLEKDQLKALVR
jgi:DNA-directed RNA polymerase subunit RPC12/RpoP